MRKRSVKRKMLSRVKRALVLVNVKNRHLGTLWFATPDVIEKVTAWDNKLNDWLCKDRTREIEQSQRGYREPKYARRRRARSTMD